MKNSIFKTILFILLGNISISAQTITYEFANAQITSAGPNSSYEVDIMISSSSSFKLGSGQIYLDYNPSAFGNSVHTNGLATISTTGYILGQSSGPFGIYSNFITNDNTTSRLSFSWQQALSSGCITSDNVDGTVTALFHLQLDFIAGGSAFDPGLCFQSAAPFDDQTFTACGPGASCTFPDCVNEPGIQITNDVFDCSASAPLPIELLSFQAKVDDQDVRIDWITATEINNDYFIIERSKDGHHFDAIDHISGAGTTNEEQHYQVWDNEPYPGLNYYRITQVDWDGTSTTSEIRAVTIASEVYDINVFPNPADMTLNITAKSEQQIDRIQLFNELGQLVLEQVLNDNQNHSRIAVDHLPRGVYFLRLGKQNPVFTERIILQ